MAHGGYGKRRVAPDRQSNAPGVERRPKSLSVKKQQKKLKTASLKNQIRSTERMLRKSLPPEIKEAQETKLEELKKQQELQTRLAVEHKVFMRYKKIKFFERRKIERRIRRLEKLQRSASDHSQEGDVAIQLSRLKEDLEYVRFFPKNAKYVSLFMGGDDADIVDKRNKLRKEIKANLMAATTSGKDLEETASEDDGLLDLSEDDFFLGGSSSDEADADDEWTDKSTREQASSASGKATSGMSSDEKNQRQVSARALMPPPRSSTSSSRFKSHNKTMFDGSSSRRPTMKRVQPSTSSNSSFSRSESSSSSKIQRSSNARTGTNSSNLSSNSDAQKPRRKRRPKKKKQQA
ncbi:hypothetical protein Syun_006959 [Stephania yunnanensis]|uniref:rRNA-processing protein EFG1 n=1 Tax=Stephania yunnanensis TaxID=152371 RepID=A0AAP0KXM3_9MAGN